MAWREKNRTKRGGYNVRWRDLSRRNRKRWAPNAKTADDLIKEVERELALGRDWRPKDADRVDLEAVFRGYIRAAGRRLKDNSLRQRERALLGFMRSLRKHNPRSPLLPQLLTRSALGDYFDDLRETCAPYTAVQRVRMVESAWRWAFDDDRFGDHVPRPRRLELEDASPELEPMAFTWAEIDQVIEHARWWYRNLLVLMRFSGLRKTQAMRLEWRDVDLEQAVMRIRPELGKTKQERRGRMVPISPHLVRELSGWGRREGYVIDVTNTQPGKTNKNREPSRQVLRDIWKRALGDKGATVRQPTHAIRKTFIAELSAATPRRDLVQYLVGHSRGVTGDRYDNDPLFLLPQLREVVSLIPALGASMERPTVVPLKLNRS